MVRVRDGTLNVKKSRNESGRPAKARPLNVWISN